MNSCSSTGGTPNLENAIFLHRKFLTKQQIFDLISEYDGQIYGEYNGNAKGIYYKIVPYYAKVLNNVRKGIENDLVTDNVTKLALELKDNPSTLFSPIKLSCIVIKSFKILSSFHFIFWICKR